LQANDQNQEASKQISEAMKKQESIEVTIRNYKKDGTLFYNRLKITPLLDKKGRIIYYLGVQYDMTEQVEANNEIRELNAIIAMLSK
jgi:PAS domain S-box-containing protein